MKKLRNGTMLILTVLSALALSGVSLRAQSGNAPSRQELLDAFRKLQKQSQAAFGAEKFDTIILPRNKTRPTDLNLKVYAGPTVRFDGVPIGNNSNASGDALQKLMVKVWAVPLDEEKQLTNKKVHLGKHRWAPKELFAIFFETSVPVQIGFYQDYEREPGGEEPRPSRQVLPDPRMPESYQTVQPGKPFRFPVNIRLDDNYKDELMSLVIVTAGDYQDLPPKKDPKTDPKKDPAKTAGENHVVFGKRYHDALDQMAKYVRAPSNPKARFNSTATTSRDASDPDMTASEFSTDHDDVAIIATSAQRYGYLQIRIRKISE